MHELHKFSAEHESDFSFVSCGKLSCLKYFQQFYIENLCSATGNVATRTVIAISQVRRYPQAPHASHRHQGQYFLPAFNELRQPCCKRLVSLERAVKLFSIEQCTTVMRFNVAVGRRLRPRAFFLNL